MVLPTLRIFVYFWLLPYTEYHYNMLSYLLQYLCVFLANVLYLILLEFVTIPMSVHVRVTSCI